MPSSYTSGRLTLREKSQEAWALYKRYRQRADEACDAILCECASATQRIEPLLGRSLKGLAVLDVGPGPFLAYSNYFAMENMVTAIDSDIIPVGFSPIPYIRMLRCNGAWRTAKTIGRKTLGIDRSRRNTLRKRLGRQGSGRLRVVHGDICNSGIADGSFDVVYCRSVLQHIPDPQRALTEMTRVLKPGGVLYVSVHLYTSYNGHQPYRPGITDDPEKLFWAHLRPVPDKSHDAAILNHLRMHNWKSLFHDICPGHTLEIHNSADPRVKPLADKYVASGELVGYTTEELTAHELICTWSRSSHAYRG